MDDVKALVGKGVGVSEARELANDMRVWRIIVNG